MPKALDWKKRDFGFWMFFLKTLFNWESTGAKYVINTTTNMKYTQNLSQRRHQISNEKTLKSWYKLCPQLMGKAVINFMAK